MLGRMASGPIYKVLFINQGEVWEMYARSVGASALFGFLEVSDLVFGERTQVVVDPSEERLEREFRNVRRFNVPIHSVIRVDEVDKEGVSRIASKAEAGAVMPFPTMVYPKPKDD
jgi:hypothetical protein